VKVIPTWAENDGLRPDAIRYDNGSLFRFYRCGPTISVWFLKLGIELRYIPSSSPQEYGRHERMHRTLTSETSCPPAKH
jgi:putative transposase